MWFTRGSCGLKPLVQRAEIRVFYEFGLKIDFVIS
jgi:hypothetical protein